MTAFNDFCIVCDQLIPAHSPNTKQRFACSNKKHTCSSDRVLYCSEQCRLKDENSLHACLDSLDSRNNGKVESLDVGGAYTRLDDSDSLITSPLLLPMDNKSSGGGDDEDDASIYCLMNMESANTIAIPRSSGSRNSLTPRGEMIYDHIPENNYKLWLSQKQ